MRFMSHKKWIVAMFGLVVAVLAVAGFLVAGPTAPQKSSSTQPKITWSEKQIEVILSPGESASKTLTFSSTLDLAGVAIEAVPEIAGFLTIQPNTISNLPASQSQQISVNFAVASGAALGIFEGTIHVRSGSQTLPQTLKLLMHVAGVGAAIFLPPDPGEAGKTTLEGIDSDGDGVRDDIQRYIALTYPSSEKLRVALAQAAKAMQASLQYAENKERSITNTIEVFHGSDCLRFVLGGVSAEIDVSSRLRSVVLNTLARSKAWIKADSQFSGQTYQLTPVGQRRAMCAFDPDSMRN